MSSIIADNPASRETHDLTESLDRESEMQETNHSLPARTMDEAGAGEVHHAPHENDDPATMAASEELKHTTISERKLIAAEDSSPITIFENAAETDAEKAQTPEQETSDSRDEEMQERISSPKKKRGRDFDDDAQDAESTGSNEANPSADAPTNGNRTDRSEPEKKRPRDTSVELINSVKEITSSKDNTTTLSPEISKISPTDIGAADNPSTKPIFGSGFSDKPKTSSSAFASSGFASLASSSSSPFGTLGSTKPSIFGGNTSGFGALAGVKSPSSVTSTVTSTGLGSTPTTKPALGFGFGGAATSSGFGSLGSGSVFGSALSNGFAGGSGQKLSSFAAPVKDVEIDTKPVKAFGAPDSGEEEGSDEEDSEGSTDSGDDDGVKLSPDDKKKGKVVKVEDGESGEATLLQLRAKLFAMESKEAGWKERGVGTLKINVPKSCAKYDDNGTPKPGSFDMSQLDVEDEKDSTGSRVPRLIMRQENTHRVILNAPIMREIEFQDKSGTTNQIMFTVFGVGEEYKHIAMILKFSDSNARLFRSEIASVQKKL